MTYLGHPHGAYRLEAEDREALLDLFMHDRLRPVPVPRGTPRQPNRLPSNVHDPDGLLAPFMEA